MNRLLVVLAAVGVMIIASIGTVSAQDQPASPPSDSDILQILRENLGIDSETLRTALQEEGATLASIIEANDGDIASIQAAVVDEIITNNPDADPEQVEERVSALLNAEHPKLGGDGLPSNNPPSGSDQRPGRPGNADQPLDRTNDSDQRPGRPGSTDQPLDRTNNSDQRPGRPGNSDHRPGRPSDFDHRPGRPGDSDHQRPGRPGNSDHRPGRPGGSDHQRPSRPSNSDRQPSRPGNSDQRHPWL